MIRWYRRRKAEKLSAHLISLVNAHVLSIDEARAKMGLLPWNQPWSR